jgi:hypothetical protein
MKTLKLRWMAKKPGQPVEELTFDIEYEDAEDRAAKELKLAQILVKGYVEVVWIGGEIKGLVNEEAMYAPDMEHNCGYLGNIVFIRESVEGDEVWFGSITDEDARKIKAWTIAHANEVHPGHGVQVFSGQAADEYRKKLHEHQKMQQQEWESF